MKSLYKKATMNSPEISFDLACGEFQIKGQSILTNVQTFYGPLIGWLEECVENPPESLTVKFHLNYYNLASAKRFMFMVYLFSKMKRKGTKLLIEWKFFQDDDFMREFGQDLSDNFEIPFSLVSSKVQVTEMRMAS